MPASMARCTPSRGIRGRLRWAEPAGVSSASELETEESVLSLAYSTDTAPSLSFSSRRPAPSTHRVRSCEARKRDGLMADLHARCQNLEGETFVLQREMRRLQELQSVSHKPVHVPLPPACAPAPHACAASPHRCASPAAERRSGTPPAISRSSCACGLETAVADLQAELGAMAFEAQMERQRQASQIAKLEAELRGSATVTDSDLVEEATAEFERWLSSQNASVARASSSQSQCKPEQNSASGSCASGELPRKNENEHELLPTGGQASGSRSRPSPPSSSGPMAPPCSAGPLPPPSYRSSDFHSLASDAYQQQPTGSNPLGFGFAGYKRCTGSARFDTPEGVISFRQRDGQLFEGSDPLFGPASFSPTFGAALAPSLAMHFGELSAPTLLHRAPPEQDSGADTSDVSPRQLCCIDELPLLPSGPPPARPPGIPVERPPPPPFMSQISTPRTPVMASAASRQSWPVQGAAVASPFEIKLTEATLREAMGALQAGSHQSSTRCTSVSHANFTESTRPLDQATTTALTTAYHTPRTAVGEAMTQWEGRREEIGRGPQLTKDGGDAKRGCVGNGSSSGIGLDEEVAMRLYQRFGLGSCMPFEKFVQLHEAHLPREKPLVRPATGGA